MLVGVFRVRIGSLLRWAVTLLFVVWGVAWFSVCGVRILCGGDARPEAW